MKASLQVLVVVCKMVISSTLQRYMHSVFQLPLQREITPKSLAKIEMFGFLENVRHGVH